MHGRQSSASALFIKSHEGKHGLPLLEVGWGSVEDWNDACNVSAFA